MEQVKVLLADGKEIFREGLARLLDEQEHIQVVSQCSNGNQAIEKVEETKPHVVLMDTDISECDDIKAIRQMNESSPEVKVAMLTDSKREHDLFSAIEAGATGYLLKNMKVGELIESIDLIEKGEVVVSPPLARRLLHNVTSTKAIEAGVKDIPSERETEILRLLVKGATNKEIAETLFIAENTAKVHIKNILEKLGLRNRQQAAAYAVQEGLVPRVTDKGDKPG
jgi:DNA-binding NarL/FixJ family response regulator